MNGSRAHDICQFLQRRSFARRWLFAEICVAVLLASAAHAQSHGSSREYDIKAAFLYHFAQFVEWPDEIDGSDPLTLCLYGHDPFGESIDRLHGREARGRQIQVRRIADEEEAAECSVLYVSPNAEGPAPEWLDRLASRHVLTVGDGEAFTELGGAIRFYKLRNKIRFEVNLDVARRAGLKISSQMLKLASVV